jgi:hypothetical protein
LQPHLAGRFDVEGVKQVRRVRGSIRVKAELEGIGQVGQDHKIMKDWRHSDGEFGPRIQGSIRPAASDDA